MPFGRRCGVGCASWPDKALFAHCPQCGEATTRYSNLTPLSDDEADSILLHKEFDKFYARYCAQLGQPVEGALC
jgi:hypothetical protein